MQRLNTPRHATAGQGEPVGRPPDFGLSTDDWFDFIKDDAPLAIGLRSASSAASCSAAAIPASDVGLPEGATHRRVTGLRREEVAQLAAISTDYYTRLEQGGIRPSPPVLESLARVLQLNRPARLYVRARRHERRICEVPAPHAAEDQAVHAARPRPHHRYAGDSS
jgi:Helix-turn-helix domain